MKITVRLHRLDIVGILSTAIRGRIGIPDNWPSTTIKFDTDNCPDGKFGAELQFRAPDHAE